MYDKKQLLCLGHMHIGSTSRAPRAGTITILEPLSGTQDNSAMIEILRSFHRKPTESSRTLTVSTTILSIYALNNRTSVWSKISQKRKMGKLVKKGCLQYGSRFLDFVFFSILGRGTLSPRQQQNLVLPLLLRRKNHPNCNQTFTCTKTGLNRIKVKVVKVVS